MQYHSQLVCDSRISLFSSDYSLSDTLSSSKWLNRKVKSIARNGKKHYKLDDMDHLSFLGSDHPSPKEVQEGSQSSIKNRIFSKEVMQPLLVAILFGILLPSGDSGSDIKLSVRLYLNNHPKWAIAVLFPVMVNTIFTLVVCCQMEKKKSNGYWIMYTPFVILQVYPQFCICRLIHQYMKNKISLKELIANRDCLDGGLGCIEPYCESVLQVFIQTAIFAYVYNIQPVLQKMCYTENAKSCNQFDTCGDPFQCSTLDGKTPLTECKGVGQDPYTGGYYMYEKVIACREIRSFCTKRHKECMELLNRFKDCISTCEARLEDEIMSLNDTDLKSFVFNPNATSEHPLALEYHATREDLESIQSYLLVIGHYWLFVLTYLISITSAVYGVAKFFRLSHARLVTDMKSAGFLIVVFCCTGFTVSKGVVLGGVVEAGNASQTPLVKSTILWFSFTMLPTLFLVITSTLVVPSFRMYEKFQRIPWLPLLKMVWRQPSLILAPHLTPFMFTIEKVYVTDRNLVKIVNERKMKKLSCYGSYILSERYTWANIVATMVFTVSLLIWKGYWITDGHQTFIALIMAVLTLTVMGLLFKFFLRKGMVADPKCLQHNESKCLECIEMFGFYIDNDEEFEACEEHEGIKLFYFKTSPKDCIKCSVIDIR